MILETICALFDVALWIIFFDRILWKRKKINPFLFYGSFILGEAAMYITAELFGETFSEFRIFTTISICLITLFATSMLYDCSYKKRLFATITFQLYASLSEILFILFTNLLPQEINDSLQSSQVYGAILAKIFTFILCAITILFYNRRRSTYNIQYSILMSITPVISIVLLVTIPIQKDLSPLQDKLSIIGIGGLLMANVINYYLLDNVVRVQELRRKEENLTNQINLQIDKYRQISEAYRSSRSIVHDVKKQYFYINECIEKNDTTRLHDFINQSIGELDNSVARINTGNLVIDSFVSNHLTLAKRSGISFDTKLHIDTTKIDIPDYDLCIILGNLLDNSYYAAANIPQSYEKHIMVEIFTSSLELLIHISNTVAPGSNTDENAESDELYHGYGTTNVARITEKHLGTYTHYVEKDWYHAIVSIPIGVK